MEKLPRTWPAATLALSIAIFAHSSALARSQGENQQQSQQPQDRSAQQTSAPEDPIQQLNLSPEQRQQIRSIREQSKDERAAINRRVRETQIALDQALKTPNPSEALIDQRAREAGEAQAAAVRMRALMQSRIQRVLTPEQVIKLRELQAEAQRDRRERRLENRANQGKGVNANRRPLPNQRNGMGPGTGLRRNGLPRKPPEQ